jgi:hypothetical protein
MEYIYEVEVSKAASHQEPVCVSSEKEALKEAIRGIVRERHTAVITCKGGPGVRPCDTSYMLIAKSPNGKYRARFEFGERDGPYNTSYKDELMALSMEALDGEA